MNTLRHSILLLIFFVGGLPCITVAQFVPNDEVELLRDEPLLFNTSVYRQGKKGERFRVAAYRADLHKVFILATDAKGKSFALSVPDAAVAPVGKDVGMLNDQAFAALRTGKLEEAQKLMLQVSVLDRERSVCAEIATHLGRVSTAQLAYQQGLKQQVQTQVEVQRKFRNAAVTDTSNPLNANDNSGRIRAEQMRKDAEQLEANAKAAIESKQEQITSELKLLSELAQKREKDGAYGEASDIGEMVAALASRQPGGSDLSGDLGRRQELKKKAAEAQKQIEDARRNVAAKKLSEALKSVEVGLSVEPGSYSLRRLQGEILQRVEVSTKAYATAVAHQQLKHYEEALKALEQARMECTDHEPSETLAATLRKTIAEKGERIAKAKTAEAAGDFATAFEVYETYAMDSDAKKILPQYAKQRETAGDFLLAYSLFEKAGLPSEMQRVQVRKEQQQAEMQKQADAKPEEQKRQLASVLGRLGETPQQCQQRYGTPIISSGSVFGFKKAGFVIVINFFEGKADEIGYRKFELNALGKETEISTNEMEQAKKFIGDGREWKEISLRSSVNREWQTTDGGFYARYKADFSLWFGTKGRVERTKAAQNSAGTVFLKSLKGAPATKNQDARILFEEHPWYQVYATGDVQDESGVYLRIGFIFTIQILEDGKFKHSLGGAITNVDEDNPVLKDDGLLEFQRYKCNWPGAKLRR
jgi:tetratricopeptide (TPR) repeat protein